MSSAHFILMVGASLRIILKLPNGFVRLLNREMPKLNMLSASVLIWAKAL